MNGDASELVAWFMIIGTFVAIAFDMIVGSKYGREATISAQLLDLARHYPLLPFAMGLFCGHALWPQIIKLGN